MAKKRERSEIDLKALVTREISLAESARAPASARQVKALEYYQGTMNDIPAEVGRSRAVSRDFADTMGWVLPGIIRVFTASEHMALCEPVGAEDEAWSKQATDGINYIFWKENDGYRNVYSATWDSLASGNGVIKTWHDDTPKTSVSFHSGLSEDELVMLLGEENGDEIEVLEYTGPLSDKASVGDGTHSVKIKRTTQYGCRKVEAIPPEDYGKDSASKTCEDARFQYHHSEATRSSLIEEGFDRTVVEGLGKAASKIEDSARFPDGVSETTDGDPSMDIIDKYECYIKVDRDGDGIAEMWQVIFAGAKGAGEILAAVEWEDEAPFDDIPCSPMPHKWEAGSLADETMDVQQIKTVLIRQSLDNTYATNNPQRFVRGKIVNPDELFSPSFGGVIFGEADSSVENLDIEFVAQHAYDAINYQDQVIERRTGVSRTTMALDPEALQNQTATANQNAKDAAYSQIELIARNQAEGWKKVFRKLLKLEIKHQDKPRTIRMGRKPVKIDPRHWNADMDISINVGLGTGSRDRDMAMLQTILNNQLMLAQTMADRGFPDKALEMLDFIMTTLMKMAEAAGIRSPELFYPEFGKEDIEAAKQRIAEMAQQPSPEEKIAAAELQADQMIEQMKAEGNAFKEKAQAEADIIVDQAKLRSEEMMKGMEDRFEAWKFQQELAFKNRELQQERFLELTKLNMKDREGANGESEPVSKEDERHEATSSQIAQLSEKVEMALAAAKAPKRVDIVRDPVTGRASHAIQTPMVN